MKVEGLDTITRDGTVYLDFYTVSTGRDGTEYTAHVTLSLRDLHGLVAQASQNRTRARPPQVMEAQVVRRAPP